MAGSHVEGGHAHRAVVDGSRVAVTGPGWHPAAVFFLGTNFLTRTVRHVDRHRRVPWHGRTALQQPVNDRAELRGPIVPAVTRILAWAAHADRA